MSRLAVIVATYSTILFQTVALVRADVLRWDNQQPIPGTEDVTLGPGVQLNDRDLAFGDFGNRVLTDANFASSNLRDARFDLAVLGNANFTGSAIERASFTDTTSRGFTEQQLYSTKSFELKDLRGIGLGGNDLSGWNFSGQNMEGALLQGTDLTEANFTDARLPGAKLDGANMSGAVILRANLRQSGLTRAQLFDTASYQQKDLRGVDLGPIDLATVDMSGQNLEFATLRDVDLSGARLVDTKLAGAIVDGTSFARTTAQGFTKQQLYSTASYVQKDLRQINLADNDLSEWNLSRQSMDSANFENSNLTLTHFDESVLRDAKFTGANLTDAYFTQTTLAGARFSGAIVNGTAFTQTNLTKEQLYSTASYQDNDLREIELVLADLSGWDFSGKNLANAKFNFSVLKGADFTGAEIEGASFSTTTIPERGFTKEQLYSTASYQRKSLRGVNLVANDITGWDFRGQDLTGAIFGGAPMNGADFTGANITGAFVQGQPGHRPSLTQAQLSTTMSYQQHDLRGIAITLSDLTGWDFHGQDLRNANFEGTSPSTATFALSDLRSAIGFSPQPTTDLRNAIRPDGAITGLKLQPNETLVVRDFIVNALVSDSFSIDHNSVLELVLSDDMGGAMVSIAGDVIPELGGTLRLAFGPETNYEDISGATIDLFDWPSPLGNSNRFDRIETPPGSQWDFSKLYATGEVTLQVIPEPSSVILFATSALIAVFAAWMKRPLHWPMEAAKSVR